MSWRACLYRVVPYLGRRAAERDLDEELLLHVELERERQRDAGLSEHDANRTARRRLGNATLIRERTRDVWGWRWLDDLGRDLRHAIRDLKRNPGFFAMVVLVLALGIGASTAMFSIVHRLLLRPLPYPDSEAIVLAGQVRPGRPGPPTLTNPELRALWEDARSFEQLAAISRLLVRWNRPDGNLFGTAVTPSLFALLRTTPQLGRLFTVADAVQGAPRVVLLSHALWASRFGSDPDAVGVRVEIEDEPHIVVGVMPPGFEPPYGSPQFWTPLVVAPFEPPTDGQLDYFPGWMVGLRRLRREVSPDQAATEVRTILDRRRVDEPWPMAPDRAPEARVVGLQEWRGRPLRPALAMLGAATGLVLLLACANVAGLLLARGIARRRELVVRGALGAGVGRVVRQLLTESVVLGLVGGTVGVAVAAGIMRTAPVLVPRAVPGLAAVAADGTMVAFAAGLSVFAGLLFGTAPALAWSRADLTRTLDTGHGAGGFGNLRKNRGQAVLAVVQVALALVLLTGAGLLLRSFVELVTLDRGFDPTNVVTADIWFPTPGYSRRGGGPIDQDAMGATYAAADQATTALLLQMERVGNLPGLVAVALSSGYPLDHADSMRPIDVPGRPAADDPREQLHVGVRRVDPGYAEVLRLRLRAGRFLAARDGPGSPRAAVVSESFARAAFGGATAVGRHLEWTDETWQVVGIVADATPLYDPPWDEALSGEIYLSRLQPEEHGFFASSLPTVVLRTAGDPDAVVPLLRELLADIHPNARIDVTTLDTTLSREALQPRFYAVCAGVFAAVALLLAAFGLYGVLSYAVSQRRREIGVRMALGARRGDVVGLVVRQGGMLVAAGVVPGLLAAAVSTRLVESVLFGVTATDVLTFAGVTAVVLAAGLLACWLPARRATRIDPMEVLRFE